MTTTFETIGIISRLKKNQTADTLQSLIAFLERQGKQIIVEKETAKPLKLSVRTIKASELAKQCDLIITVGGDGNMLSAARLAAPYRTPILGINRGKFGFLTDIRPDRLGEMISDILAGNYKEGQRFLLKTEIYSEQKLVNSGLALNDVILAPNETSHMLEFEIQVNQKFMCSQQSDGLIIATPTGSTAYSLSGGGPILHPYLNAILMVPMFPHSLTHRPIVLDGDSEIDILVPDTTERLPRVSCDGQDYMSVHAGDVIKVKKYEVPLRLIHPLSYSYFASLRGKFHWGQRLSNDPQPDQP